MARVAGLGRALPGRVVANAELARSLGVTEEWILGACGIRERRRAGPGEDVVELARRAASSALEAAGLPPSALGAIVVGTGSAPRRFPGVSAELQRLLGAPGIPAFDVPLASAGGLFALALAVDLSPRYGNVLAVGADVLSGALGEPPPRETAILFGDGAGAAVVTRGAGGLEVLDVRLGGDGAFADALRRDASGPLAMDGRTVILQASRKLPGAVRDLLDRNGVAPGDVDLYVLHQANLNLLRAVGRSLGVPESRVFVDLDRLGNTSAASVLIALSEAVEERRLPAGSRLVLGAFGAGFSWGAALLAVRG